MVGVAAGGRDVADGAIVSGQGVAEGGSARQRAFQATFVPLQPATARGHASLIRHCIRLGERSVHCPYGEEIGQSEGAQAQWAGAAPPGG